MAEMDDTRLKAILGAHIADAKSHMRTEVLDPADEAERLFLGAPLGNEIEGRSTVISRDVMDAIEWMMPFFMRVFHGTDQPVAFQPTRQEDEEAATQATDYVSAIYNVDNDGFLVTEEWIKGALIYRYGAVKHWWEIKREVVEKRFAGATMDEVTAALEAKDVELIEAGITQAAGPDGAPVDVINGKLRQTTERGRECIAAIPPEELLIVRGAKTIQDATFAAHWRQMSRSALIEAGYDRKIIDALEADNDQRDDDRWSVTRDRDSRDGEQQAVIDEANRLISVYDCAVRIDFDDDGIAELRRIVVVGPNADTILSNDPIKTSPFKGFTPISLPFRLIGQAIVDLVRDIQVIKTTLWRQMLDGLYLSTTPVTDVERDALLEDRGLDDFYERKPGGVRLVKRLDGVRDSVPQWGGAQAFPMVEYLDSQAEGRSGVSRTTQGLNPDVLNPNVTASAAMQQMTAAQSRIELIARRFAELGLKPLFRGVLADVIEHQREARSVKLRDQWMSVDPQAWNPEMDVKVQVGLGTGNRELRMALLSNILGVQEKILGAGGLGGMVTPQQIHNTLEDLVRAGELSDVTRYFAPPQPPDPSKPPPPDPKLVQAQAEMQLRAQQAQAEQQLKEAQAASDLQLQRERLAMEAQSRREEIAAEAALKRWQAEQEMALKREQMAAEIELKRLQVVMVPGRQQGETEIARPT